MIFVVSEELQRHEWSLAPLHNKSTAKYNRRFLVQGLMNVGFIELVLGVLDEDTQVLRELF